MADEKKPAPVPTVRTAGRPVDSLPSDRADGKDELLIQYIDPQGMVREQFAGVIAERKSGDPFADKPGPVEWVLPPLFGPPPRAGFTIRAMVLNHSAKWKATVTASDKNGFMIKGEPEVKT